MLHPIFMNKLLEWRSTCSVGHSILSIPSVLPNAFIIFEVFHWVSCGSGDVNSFCIHFTLISQWEEQDSRMQIIWLGTAISHHLPLSSSWTACPLVSKIVNRLRSEFNIPVLNSTPTQHPGLHHTICWSSFIVPERQEILSRLRFLANKPSVPSAMSFLAQLKDLSVSARENFKHIFFIQECVFQGEDGKAEVHSK